MNSTETRPIGQNFTTIQLHNEEWTLYRKDYTTDVIPKLSGFTKDNTFTCKYISTMFAEERHVKPYTPQEISTRKWHCVAYVISRLFLPLFFKVERDEVKAYWNKKEHECFTGSHCSLRSFNQKAKPTFLPPDTPPLCDWRTDNEDLDKLKLNIAQPTALLKMLCGTLGTDKHAKINQIIGHLEKSMSREVPFEKSKYAIDELRRIGVTRIEMFNAMIRLGLKSHTSFL